MDAQNRRPSEGSDDRAACKLARAEARDRWGRRSDLKDQAELHISGGARAGGARGHCSLRRVAGGAGLKLRWSD